MKKSKILLFIRNHLVEHFCNKGENKTIGMWEFSIDKKRFDIKTKDALITKIKGGKGDGKFKSLSLSESTHAFLAYLNNKFA